MSHDLKQQEQQEPLLQTRDAPRAHRVNVDEAGEASYWCRRLHCTEAALRSALISVGPIAEDVERHLSSARKR